MLFALFLALASAAADPSFTSEELALRKHRLTEVGEAMGHADADLPPCEDIAYGAGVAYHESDTPPASCPVAKRAYEAGMEIDRRLRANCREMTAWVEGVVQDQSAHCGKSDYNLMVLKALTARKKAMTEGQPEIDDELPPAEEKNMKCELAFTIAQQMRKKELALMTRHYGTLDYRISELCADPGNAEYIENYIRYGEAGNEH